MPIGGAARAAPEREAWDAGQDRQVLAEREVVDQDERCPGHRLQALLRVVAACRTPIDARRIGVRM